LEYYLSGPGIVRIAEILCGSDEQSMFSEELRRDIAGKHVGASDILQKADAGEPFALNVVGVFFDYLQHLLSIIQHILSPEIVVFGGGIISGNYDVIREKISGLSKVYPFRIQLSTLGNRAGMIGAGLYALEETKFRTT
jgi:predicted NBD/HSP70 family sugar kinase